MSSTSLPRVNISLANVLNDERDLIRDLISDLNRSTVGTCISKIDANDEDMVCQHDHEPHTALSDWLIPLITSDDLLLIVL